jgi:hypothetical protein
MMIAEFVDSLRRAKNLLEAVRGTYINVQLIAKVSGSLPTEYDKFFSQKMYYCAKVPDFNRLVKQLESYEARYSLKPVSSVRPESVPKNEKSKKVLTLAR